MATLRLPIFEVTYPENGTVINDPTGMAKRTAPSVVSERLSRCWMFGMREAQVAKRKP